MKPLSNLASLPSDYFEGKKRKLPRIEYERVTLLPKIHTWTKKESERLAITIRLIAARLLDAS